MTTLSVQSWYLECRENAFKFYEVHYIEDGHVVLRWGRIGAYGTTKVERLDPEGGRTVALRQVYTKAAKGYDVIKDCIRWEVDFNPDEPPRRQQPGEYLIQSYDHIPMMFPHALADPQFSGERAIVIKHYESFITQCERLMNEAAESKFEDVLPEFNRLQHQFEAIKEMHDRAKGTMDMTDRMLMQKLMG